MSETAAQRLAAVSHRLKSRLATTFTAVVLAACVVAAVLLYSRAESERQSVRDRALTTTSNNGVDWFGTVRARAGFAVDRFLIYATGGFAFSDSNNNNNNTCLVGAAVVACGNGGSNSTGWTVGGGVEWAMPVNWFGSSAVTLGVEGLYVNLGSNNNDNVFNNVAFNNSNRSDNEFGVVRAKLNFKF